MRVVIMSTVSVESTNSPSCHGSQACRHPAAAREAPYCGTLANGEREGQIVSTGRIVIVSGPPGAGKSATARRLAESSGCALAMHLHCDDFYAYIRKGYVPPWQPESRTQNAVVADALAATAAIFAKGGYDVFVDGIVGPWFFEPWLEAAARTQADLRYVLLLPDEATTVSRATAREPPALTDAEPVRFMWRQFARLPDYAPYIVDTSKLDVADASAHIEAELAKGRFRLPASRER
jgi:predicted kinase